MCCLLYPKILSSLGNPKKNILSRSIHLTIQDICELHYETKQNGLCENNNSNEINNNIYYLLFGFHPVAVVILHVKCKISN
jgi:hypothetical protein